MQYVDALSIECTIDLSHWCWFKCRLALKHNFANLHCMCLKVDVCKVPKASNQIGSSSWYCAEQKVRAQMNECERHVSSAGNLFQDDKEAYWEGSMNKLVLSCNSVL